MFSFNDDPLAMESPLAELRHSAVQSMCEVDAEMFEQGRVPIDDWHIEIVEKRYMLTRHYAVRH